MNAPILRFADVILVYAEAAAELGLDSDAHDALDLILTRAQNGGSYPALVDRSLTGDNLKASSLSQSKTLSDNSEKCLWGLIFYFLEIIKGRERHRYRVYGR